MSHSPFSFRFHLAPFHWPVLVLACALATGGLHAEEERTASFKYHPNPPDVKLAEPPKLEDPEAFSMIVLGDPQSYVKFDINQPIFELQTAWAAAQKERLKVKTVICTGDLVEHNDLLTANGGTLYPGQNNGNQTSVKQWENVSHAFKRLDHVYPYVVTTGNHDFGYENAENRNSRFPEFFNLTRNPLWEKTIVSTAPNAFGHHSLENAAYEFTDKVWGGLLVVVLEFKPRDEAIDWAGKLISSERYAGHKVILLTHSFLDTDGSVTGSSKYKVSPGNEAAQIVEKLIKPSKNIKLVICGHTGDTETMSAFRSELNAEGKAVHMMMFNPQAISGWNGNGGDGWLRILEFKSDGKTIKARTYSPLFGASQKTESFAWSRDAKNEFQFVLDEMPAAK